MLKIIGFFISFLLIFVITIRTPQENSGLSSFANKSNLLGSPDSAERLLNILTIIGILIYLSIAIRLNVISVNI